MRDKRETLEKLYEKYHRRKFVHPDPLEFLYSYPDMHDREVVALVASSLAYGRVAQILKSVRGVLDVMVFPGKYVRETPDQKIENDFAGFKHRFTTGDELAAMLKGVKRLLVRYGSLGGCFSTKLRPDDDTVLYALASFVDELWEAAGKDLNFLLPHPKNGSACKRLHLFLRWMIRSDQVDPGGWNDISPSKLVVPLDTHMHSLCRRLGFTNRKQANAQAAVEVTEAFRIMVPEDPVRYDFSLTRLGIRNDADYDEININ
jgi:uncharacterized protein (TIGR02757 family)